MKAAAKKGDIVNSKQVAVGTHALEGVLTVPEQSLGAVMFVHGSGSSRFSPRNLWVAQWLQRCQLATLLFDLLTPAEDLIRDKVFDIDLLAGRTEEAIDWLRDQHELESLPLGLFGASTGGAAALIAAAKRPKEVAAVVSRGGRPDLAGSAMEAVQAPTLLIVGEADSDVLKLNQAAYRHLKCEKHLSVVDNATHLFPEPRSARSRRHIGWPMVSETSGTSAVLIKGTAQLRPTQASAD